MSTLLNVGELVAPPVVGRYYLVPHVNLLRHNGNPESGMMWLPALGGVHADPELGGVGVCPHVHYDLRFCTHEHLRKISGLSEAELRCRIKDDYIWPFAGTVRSTTHNMEIRVMRAKCLRESVTFPATAQRRWGTTPWWNPLTYRLENRCAGMRLDPANPVCPHKGVRLHDQPTDADGCVTCPGHGLKWNRATGEMVTRYAELPSDVRQRFEADSTASPIDCIGSDRMIKPTIDGGANAKGVETI